MSFMFNFSNSEGDSTSDDTQPQYLENEAPTYLEEQICQEISADNSFQGAGDIPVTSYEVSPQLCICCLQSSAVEERLCGRSPAESGRAPAESGRAPAESGRSPAESGRSLAESGRAPAESGRAPAESGRAPAESGRSPAESGRSPAESGRSPAESGRALAESGTIQAARSHSDLLPNVYEGGLKVWECAVDLAQYLCSSGVDFCGKTVVELGCGAGLPGMVAVKSGASEVHFQDFNVEVIENYTIPNVAMNRTDSCSCKCRYFSGDWDMFRQHIQAKDNTRYDVILTAETIYRQENYSKLSRFFEHCLAPSGVVYLAAKSNYFGVGGGTSDFSSFLSKQGTFQTQICHTIGEGVPREVWKITYR